MFGAVPAACLPSIRHRALRGRASSGWPERGIHPCVRHATCRTIFRLWPLARTICLIDMPCFASAWMEALDSFILNTSARVGSAGSIVLTPSAALISRTNLRTDSKKAALAFFHKKPTISHESADQGDRASAVTPAPPGAGIPRSLRRTAQSCSQRARPDCGGGNHQAFAERQGRR